MMCDRDDLETEWLHVIRKARLDDLGRVNALFSEMSEALLKEPANGAENLEVVCDGCVVKREDHGVLSRHFCVLIAFDTVVARICSDCKLAVKWRRATG